MLIGLVCQAVHHCTTSYRLTDACGAAQVREPSLFRRKMLWMSGLRHRMCSRRPRVNIVDNATGQAKMGELVGVLGPSGFLLCLRPLNSH